MSICDVAICSLRILSENITAARTHRMNTHLSFRGGDRHFDESVASYTFADVIVSHDPFFLRITGWFRYEMLKRTLLFPSMSVSGGGPRRRQKSGKESIPFSRRNGAATWTTWTTSGSAGAKRKRELQEAATKGWKWLLWESGIARRRAHPTKARGGGLLRVAEDG